MASRTHIKALLSTDGKNDGKNPIAPPLLFSISICYLLNQ
nr:MAG TPA: hypothetical protein [Caudoviricetes sp.]